MNHPLIAQLPLNEPGKLAHTGITNQIKQSINQSLLSLMPPAGQVDTGLLRAGYPPIVLVRNDSGADRVQGDVLGIDDLLVTPAAGDSATMVAVQLVGTVPEEGDHTGKFVVLLQNIEAGGVGYAFMEGTWYAKVNIVNEDDEWAEIKDGDATQLESGSTGSARILGKEAGTGTKWALVQLGMPQPDSDEEPDTVGSTDETEAAATDEWDAEDTDASPNVDIVMQTRTAYNHAGDKKLYAYYRTFSYVCGRLVKISAETRVEIDAPEDC